MGQSVASFTVGDVLSESTWYPEIWDSGTVSGIFNCGRCSVNTGGCFVSKHVVPGNLGQVKASLTMEAAFSSYLWYRCARKSPFIHALHPVFQKFLQRYL